MYKEIVTCLCIGIIMFGAGYSLGFKEAVELGLNFVDMDSKALSDLAFQYRHNIAACIPK